ncbi:MAG: HlyC/CorC family transporter [Fimbriimonadaceae bacterium]|nr:HlyC/CorC family transporter [Fimbriimonadaceae bacterium]
MGIPEPIAWALSVLFLLGNAFFVAAEYAMVGARKSRVEGLAKHGNRSAKSVLESLGRMASYVAGMQVAITMLGLCLGAITEPLLTDTLVGLMGPRLGPAGPVISILLMTYSVVVVGELIPKYMALRAPERVALAQTRFLRGAMVLLAPVVWVVQRSGFGVLRAFGVDVSRDGGEGLSKEELLLAVRAAESEGHLEETHARVISRVFRLDRLKVQDVMIHRMDIQWLDEDASREDLPNLLRDIRHSRIPVCRGDIDDVLGVVYLGDMVARWDDEDFDLKEVTRPVETVPESVTLDQAAQLMRERKTHILLVLDEYGGTSGLVTLEDIVEEIFGDMEDSLESDRPRIEQVGPYRVSARADVRYDELREWLRTDQEYPDDAEFETDTLAEIVTKRLARVPVLGDAVELGLGTLRVDNMARRRITRLSLTVKRRRSSEET